MMEKDKRIMKISSEYKFKQRGSTPFQLVKREFNGGEYMDGSVLTPYGIVEVSNSPMGDFPFLLRFDFIANGYHFIKSYKVKKLYTKNGLARMAATFAKECLAK